jgi:hypothetical protein
VPPRATFRAGCPGATRTRDPRLRTAVLCSTELRDKRSSRAQAATARKLVRVVGFEPTASCVRGRNSPGLSYTLLALRREIESLSPDRQSGRLTRCVTERRIGASGPTRTATECALNALPLPIGVQTHAIAKLEDQAGFEPAVSLRCRLKRPARSTATETGPVDSRARPPKLRRRRDDEIRYGPGTSRI